MYAGAAAAGAGGSDDEGAEEAIVDWRHEEKLFDERHYLTGLLWNVQMYIDGYCPDYQFAYRCVHPPVGVGAHHGKKKVPLLFCAPAYTHSITQE